MAFRQYSENDKMLMDDATLKKIASYIKLEFLEKVSAYFK